MSRLVPGSGNPLAKIVLVGEAPGRREEESGLPFTGGAGQMLDAILRSSGLMRSQLYITNVVKVRPPNNDFSCFYVGRQPTNELLEWRGKLLNELAAIRPNVIVPMGNEALAALMNMRGITNWRGSILWSKLISAKVIPAVHPAFILRGQWEMMPITVLDFKRIKEQSMFPEYRVKLPNLIVTQSKEHSLGLLDEMIKSKTPVVVDIETTRDGTCSITAIGFSNDSGWGFSIPMVAWQGNKWPQEDEIDIWLRIKVLLESTTVVKIMQNAQFDMYVLKVVTGIMTKNLWMDTMVAQFDCYPELPKGLDTLASIYTELPYWKHKVKENLCEYNAMDAVGTYQVAMELDKELEDCHVKDLYYKRDHLLLEPIMEMQLRGVRMDMDKRKVAATIVRGQISEIEKRLYSKVGIVNINSPKQVASLLYDKLGLPKQFKRGTTKLTTDEGAINKLSAKFPSEELDWILELRGLSKLVSTYLESTLDTDNRIRSSYMVGGTLTGRLSSSQTVFKTGCLLPNAEVLTPEGWVEFQNLEDGIEVMQWKEDGTLSFCTPKRWQFLFEGDMIEADADFHRNVYTPEHRIPTASTHFQTSITRTLNKRIVVEPAQELLTIGNRFLPVSGYYNGYKVMPEIRLVAMVQADGSIEGNNIRLTFKKQRKIDRCLKLFEDFGIDFTEQKSEEGMRRFCISVKDSKPIIDMLGKDKLFDSWIFLLSNTTLQEFIDEIRYWDSHIRGNSFQYYTGIEQNASVVATVAHLCGYSASTRVVPSRTFDSMERQTIIPGKFMWTVAIKPRAYVQTNPKHFSKHPYKGNVYCVTTETGFFLTRYRDRICVTGNSNLQNIPPGICREIFLPDEGKVLGECDLSQAESRVVAWLAKDEKMIRMFAEGGDIHKKMASLIYDKNVEDVTKDERRIAKTAGHASNYLIGIKKFAAMIGKPPSEAIRIQDKYYSTFPRIRLWHAMTEDTIRRTRTLITPLGRRRVFYGMITDDLVREAVAYVPQSTVADTLNIALLSAWNEWKGQDIQLLLQVHDSFVFQFKMEDIESIKLTLAKAFDVKIPVDGYAQHIPYEFKVGVNWNMMKEVV